MKKIAVLGSTGSIGTMTLDVVRRNPGKFRVAALAAGRNIDLLNQQVREFRPGLVSVMSDQLRRQLLGSFSGRGTEFLSGDEGLLRVATAEEADVVVAAVTGSAGLLPVKAAIEAHKEIALANKEAMVMGGQFLTGLARDNNVRIIPIDSEHSAIFQCLAGNRYADVSSLILTASGGPFIDFSPEEMKHITVERALAHPVWNMGAKVSIDSATMMNKGLEVIEARWLFDISPARIEVVVHRQSIVHSLVRYHDGSILGQLGRPDMRIPILYALTYPERWPLDLPQLDLCEVGHLTFEQPDYVRFPCLKYAFEALKSGGSAPIILNRADEVAVTAFLDKRVTFTDIPIIIQQTLDQEATGSVSSFSDIMEFDARAKQTAEHFVAMTG